MCISARIVNAKEIGRLLIGKARIGVVTASLYYLITYIILPILTERGINAEGYPTLTDGIPVFFGIMITLTIYLFMLHTVEMRETLRYGTLFLLSLVGIILPTRRIWQLKYGFNTNTEIADKGFADFNVPPWIEVGAKPIINPLLYIPGYHPDYTEAVHGYAPFRNIGIILMVGACMITLLVSIFMVQRAFRGILPIIDKDGKLLESQADITLPHNKIHNFLDSFLTIINVDESNEHLRDAYNAFIFLFEFVIIQLTNLGIQLLNLVINFIAKIGNKFGSNREAVQFDSISVPQFQRVNVVALPGSIIAYLAYLLQQLVQFIIYLFLWVTSLGLYRKKDEGRLSLNGVIQRMGLYMLLGLVFVFLSLEGFHGMKTFFSQPGVYLALFIFAHLVYLPSSPALRQHLRNTRLAYAFILPTIAILLFELYVPILIALFLSFQDIFQFPFNNYDERVFTSNVGWQNYSFIVDSNLVQIVLIFTLTAFIIARILKSLNNETSASRRIVGKLLTLGIWISMLYWTITLNLAPRYADYISEEVSIFIDPSPVPVFINTVIWTVTCVFFHLVIGTVLGLLMNTEFRARGVVRSIMIIPWAVPNFITISIFSAFIFDNDSGLVNIMLSLFHIETFKWVATENIMLTSIIVNIWLGFPFIMVSVLASLQSIPADLYEAAEIDGASAWQKFRHITLPMIKPTLYVVSLLGFLWTFNLFNVIYLMTIDKQSVLAVDDYYILIVYIFAVFRGGNWSIAATLSFLLFLLVAAFSAVYTVLMGKGPYELGESEEDDDIE